MAISDNNRTLTEPQWEAIRRHWEFDTDEPSGVAASQRAGERLGFRPPSRQAIGKRKALDATRCNPWQRRGSMVGIVDAAQRKADILLKRDNKKILADVEAAIEKSVGPKPEFKADADVSLQAAWEGSPESLAEIVQDARETSEDQRAEILVRHRMAWSVIDVLREEALSLRGENANLAQERMRLTKITAETLHLQQTGERKAWGLDDKEALFKSSGGDGVVIKFISANENGT